MKRDYVGDPICPDPIPSDVEELLELMDDAAEHAGTAQGAGAPAFDHGMRIFTLLKGHYDLQIAREMSATHLGLKQATDYLKKATNALKIATWLLAIITGALGIIEAWKMFLGH